MTRPLFTLILGLAVGFTLGLLSVWTSPMFIFQRIGMGIVMMAALAAFIYSTALVIDLALMTCKLHKEFLAFVFQRGKARRGKGDF